MTSNRRVTVYGAYGHTGRFVVAELRRRGWTPVVAGRDRAKLEALDATCEPRVASVDDPASLDAAIRGSRAVINCAGPFADTSVPVIEAAQRAGIHYLDVAAEQAAVLHVFEQFANTATSDVVIAPAMGFFGGLGDLVATSAMGDWDRADEIRIAVALDSWHPTRGTRLTGERNHGPRYIYANNTLERSDARRGGSWTFPQPFGAQDVVPLSLSETILIPHHVRVTDVAAYINATPLAELRNPDTPAPTATSSQVFLVDVIVRKGEEERRLAVRGRDIYAITAPIVVEAVERVLDGRVRQRGLVAAGALFDASDYLRALASGGHVEIEGD